MKNSPRPEDIALAQRAAEAIRRLQPDAEIFLYGSRARGKPVKYSDMDILVLTPRKLHWKEEWELMDSVCPVEDEGNVIICPIIEERERWYSGKYQAMPLAKAVKKDGIKI
jgi:uncharacterized protein